MTPSLAEPTRAVAEPALDPNDAYALDRVFLAAGLKPGMRVLDLGSGAGDVAMLVARVVGSAGSVLGVERGPAAVALATARVEQAGMPKVRYVEDDVQTLAGVEGEFDAVTGRLVLMYLSDPPGALRRAIELLRPGALVCVQEGDMAYDWAEPMTPLWSQIRAWFLETLELAGVAPRMGLSLSSTFIAAGLPAPEMRLECAVGGGRRADLGLGQRGARSAATDGASRGRNPYRRSARHASRPPAR